VRCRWIRLCSVCPSHSHLSFLSKAILALRKARSRREPNPGSRVPDRPEWCDALPESLHESCRMDRRIVVMKLICSLGHCECDSHTVHKLSQRRLTADWLSPRESDYSRMHIKVSSDWMLSYIKTTLPVLEIFKMAGYFPDSPRMSTSEHFRSQVNILPQMRPYSFNIDATKVIDSVLKPFWYLNYI
jgi:hypothetical protein